MADGLNDARAMRILELMNDYRTLQHHIEQQLDSVAIEDVQQEGFRVLAQSSTAARRLLVAGFTDVPIEDQGSDREMVKAKLRQLVLDASGRRFQAHRIYLRVAAAKRWAINRHNIISRFGKESMTQLREIDQILQQELNNITNQSIFADLRQADTRKGYWVAEDPPLAAIQLWENSQRT